MVKTTIEELKSLCDYDGSKYVSKQGQDYINALSQVFDLKNKNDKPFTIDDILQQPTLSSFRFTGKNEFIYTCKLQATPMIIKHDKRKNEKIIAFDFVNDEQKNIFNKALGIAYLITYEINNQEYIIKIGSSRNTFRDRLGSYNCGVVNNWRTASTTNIKILQSFVTTRLVFKLYLCDCSEPYQINWHGVLSPKLALPKSLAIEDIMLKQFIAQFGHKPLANIQANATQVD